MVGCFLTVDLSGSCSKIQGGLRLQKDKEAVKGTCGKSGSCVENYYCIDSLNLN